MQHRVLLHFGEEDSAKQIPVYGGPSLQDGQTSNLILRIEVGALARRHFI